MTREEIIKQGRPTEPYCFETDREEQWYSLGLYDGATANPWHSVADGDLPKEPKGNEYDLPFLTQFEDDITLSYYAADEDNPDVFDFYDECGCAILVNYWMEIPQLPK